MDNMDELKKELKLVKLTYIWEINNEYYERNKLFRTDNDNIKIPIFNTFYEDKEIILKPRYISINPFKENGSLLVYCDIYDIMGNQINNDDRLNLIKLIEASKNKLNPKISVKLNIKLEKTKYEKKKNILETIINLSIKSKLNTNEYYIEDDDLVLTNEFNNILECIDEIYLLRYIINCSSKILEYDYNINDKIRVKFIDDNTIKDNGLESINKYSSNLNKLNVIIPDSINMVKKGYFIYNYFKFSECLYKSAIKFLNTIYK
jgi:hypothetical protein